MIKVQRGNIVHLKDGRKGKAFGKYMHHRANPCIMVEIAGKDYSTCNYKSDLIDCDQITKVTS